MGKLGSLKNKVVCNISWNRPSTGWCKLNTDGASFGNLGKARQEEGGLSEIVRGDG